MLAGGLETVAWHDPILISQQRRVPEFSFLLVPRSIRSQREACCRIYEDGSIQRSNDSALDSDEPECIRWEKARETQTQARAI